LEKAGTSFSLKVMLTCWGAATTALAAGIELTTWACARAGAAGASAAAASARRENDLPLIDPFFRNYAPNLPDWPCTAAE
jgi:hypothetical protein